MMRMRQTYLGRLLLVALTLAMLSLPFAHRAGAAPASPQMAQFIAMGGSIDDICRDIENLTLGSCESCRIVTAMYLTAPFRAAHPAFVPIVLRADQTAYITAPDPAPHLAPPVRAPPRA